MSGSNYNFKFITAPGSVEVKCGDVSLGHTDIQGMGTNVIKVTMPAREGAAENAAACEKEETITAIVKVWSSNITDSYILEFTAGCFVCNSNQGCSSDADNLVDAKAIAQHSSAINFKFKQGIVMPTPYLDMQYATFIPPVKGSYGRMFFKPHVESPVKLYKSNSVFTF